MTLLRRLALVVLVSMFVGVGVASADTIKFAPQYPALSQYPHGYWWVWGLEWSLPVGQQIASATLTYANIYDSTGQTNWLYTHLLDEPAVSGPGPYGVVTEGYHGGGSDYFLDPGSNFGPNVELGVASLPLWPPTTVVYSISPAQFSWLADGKFGIGIDAECFYVADSVVFQIDTVPVPEPETLLLFGFGLVGLARVARRKK